ncbi:hypothetical protein ADIARSV_1680 [Arcticibacter svalbardensis MN12-7]|uniref:Uncharacterized protein n=1 Tax=Arcticibacter svalbardensis MN12-7 TaxID=1150600 RepID=R9GTN3_9SPHI|nr:hypothetical protein ADIARSV_1680 [Arcticibacter svalbardensis MN12-7]
MVSLELPVLNRLFAYFNFNNNYTAQLFFFPIPAGCDQHHEVTIQWPSLWKYLPRSQKVSFFD